MTPATARAPTAWLDDPVESGPAAGFGLYLHVPFCAHRCGYCDFATFDDRAHLQERYVADLRDGIARSADADGWPEVTSVFVGGGTPTVLTPDVLAGLIELVYERFRVVPGAEVTVEANPETVDGRTFEVLAAAGVNRVSLGAQSFAPHVLAVLERQHTPDRPAAAVAAARAAGIGQVNLDLIYGTPGETDDDWRRSLDTVLDLGVDHVSAYALTVAVNTPFARQVASGTVAAPDPDLQRARFEVAREVLGDAGFEHYEVSNWAWSPTSRSSHNTLYWRHGDYLGIGVGAHGHIGGHRWWAPRTIERWCEDVETGRRPVAGEEHLSIEERAEERLLLGLRLREGLHPRDVPPLHPEAVEDATRAGLLQLSCGRFQATDDGWFLLDELLRRLA